MIQFDQHIFFKRMAQPPRRAILVDLWPTMEPVGVPYLACSIDIACDCSRFSGCRVSVRFRKSWIWEKMENGWCVERKRLKYLKYLNISLEASSFFEKEKKMM